MSSSRLSLLKRKHLYPWQVQEATFSLIFCFADIKTSNISLSVAQY